MTATGMDKPLYSAVATLGLITLTVYLLVVGEQILLPLVLAILVSYLITALGHRIQRLRVGLGPFEQSRHLGRGQQRVAFGLERSQLVAADLGAAARHHDRRIPAKQGQRTAERVQAFPLLFELLVGGRGHGTPGIGTPIVPGGVPGGRPPTRQIGEI